MENPRKYGHPPYKIAVVHGGPGAQGGMAEVAAHLSSYAGILEPLQTECSVDGEITELHKLITSAGDQPFILIGHSWGAWLSILTAARYPESVAKLILVASAPFEESYAASIHKTRMERLTADDQREFSRIMSQISSPDSTPDGELSRSLHRIILKSDCYEMCSDAAAYADEVTVDPRIFSGVWSGASEIRSSGELLKSVASLKCPVVAIHGEYDPHPGTGVKLPLGRIISDFRFILFEKCGHYPWLEKLAYGKFYEVLRTELHL